MLIATEDIPCCFAELVKWAKEVDIATAWASVNVGLNTMRAQAPRSKRIRAIVGLWGNSTDPAALRILKELGELRIVDDSRCFHPKVYIFRDRNESVAWIGSANFTTGGFVLNTELVYQTSDTTDIQSWFNRRWRDCGRLPDGAIDEYARRRKRNPPKPSPPTRGPKPRPRGGPLALLQGVVNWEDYLNALDTCDRWWASVSRGDGNFSVLGETHSWYETIDVLRILLRQELEHFNEDDGKRLLGVRGTGPNWGLLGSMRPKAFGVVFNSSSNRKTIQDAIDHVARADYSEFPRAAIEAYESMRGVRDLGTATATRLLALTRPDYVVSLNDGSRAGLAKYFDMALPEGNVTSDRYRELLEILYEMSWFDVVEPEIQRERGIWSMRAALIDCFVYRRR